MNKFIKRNILRPLLIVSMFPVMLFLGLIELKKLGAKMFWKEYCQDLITLSPFVLGAVLGFLIAKFILL